MKKRLLTVLAVVVLLLLVAPVALADDLEDPLHANTTGNAVTPKVAISTVGLVEQVDPSTVAYTNCTDFEDVTGGSAPGTNYDGILTSGGMKFAERFTGQTLQYNYEFDALSGSPTSPLSLQVGLSNQNIDVYDHGPGHGNAVDGLGPLGYPDYDAIGEGSIAVLFPNPQTAFKIDITGVDGGGLATFDLFKSDGSSLGTIVINPATTTYGFKTTTGLPEIAGFSIYNTDPAGIGYDNFCYTLAEEGDTTPPTVDNFYADKASNVIGDTIRFSYFVSDTGGSGLKQVELWEAMDTDGDNQPNWPPGQTDYVSMQTLSGDNASGYFDYKPQELGTHWYGIHIVDNDGNWNDERNSRSGGLPGVFGPRQIDVVGIIVNQPNGGETWDAGASQLITWISFGVTGKVDIKLSRDGGNKWKDIVLNSANDGNEIWKATNPTTDQALIKIVSKSNPTIYDFSNSTFSIIKATQRALAIRDFWPKSGYSGIKVNIIGDNFVNGKTKVQFGAIKADEDDIEWISSTWIKVRVPNALEAVITGQISVTTSEGTAVSSENFIVMAPAQPWGTQIGVYNGIIAYSNGGWWSVHYDEAGNITKSGYGYAYQCVEYVNRYYMVHFSHNMTGTGNADSYLRNTANKGLVGFKNGRTDAPKVNDILVFDGDNKLNGKSLGHVAIITNLETNQSGQITALWIIQQNVISTPGGNYTATAKLAVNVTEKKNGIFTYWVDVSGSGIAIPVIGWSRLP